MIVKDKTLVITGVGPGLGREIASAALRDGARVVLAARKAEKLEWAVEAALAGDLRDAVEIVSLSPLRLGEVWASIRQAGAALGIERSSEDLLFIYTGGTTGMPKGVMWQAEALCNRLRAELFVVAQEQRTLVRLGKSREGCGDALLKRCKLLGGFALTQAFRCLTLLVKSLRIHISPRWSYNARAKYVTLFSNFQ